MVEVEKIIKRNNFQNSSKKITFEKNILGSYKTRRGERYQTRVKKITKNKIIIKLCNLQNSYKIQEFKKYIFVFRTVIFM